EEGALETAPPPPSPAPEARPPVPPTPMRPRPPIPARHDERPRRGGTSMGAHAFFLDADGLALGAGIFSEVEPAWLQGRLAFRLEAAGWRRRAVRDAGTAQLTWLFLRAQFCGKPAVRLAVSLCGLIDGGALHASATRARNPLSYSAPWAGAGVAVRAAWR